LRELTISNNRISFIGAVARLAALEELDLSWNDISDIDVVGGLVNLKSLKLSSNNISRVGAVAGLASLIELDLSHNQIKMGNRDAMPLSNLRNLERLSLAGAEIKQDNLEEILSLTRLKYLDLSATDINRFWCIERLFNLGALIHGSVLNISYTPGLDKNCNDYKYNMSVLDSLEKNGVSVLRWVKSD